MRKLGFRKAIPVIFSILLVVALLVAGCGKTTAPATTAPPTTTAPLATVAPTTVAPTTAPPGTTPPQGTEIRIGIMGGQTGPAPQSVTALIKELEYIFKYVNEVEGGIDGAKLTWRVMDNKGTPEGAILAYRELRDNFKPLIYVAVEDYYLTGIKNEIAEDQATVITFSTIQPQVFVPPGRFFSLAIATSDGFGGFAKYIVQQQKGGAKPKIGVLTWDLPSGQSWRQAQAWAMKQGVDIEAVQFPMATLDLKPQLLKLRDAGVTHIWVQALGSQAAMVIRDYKGLGLTAPLYFMEYTESNQLVGLVGEGADGFYIYRSETPSSDGSDSAKLYQKIYKFAEGKEKESDNRLPLTAKAVIQAAVKQAVVDVGWSKLDSNAVFGALNKLNQIDTWGNSPGFGFGTDKRVGVSSVRIAQFSKGKVVSITEPITLPRIFEGIDK